MLAIAIGMRTTMPAKMISEIPLPMPRSVICSPSHMMKAVPEVSVMIVSSRNARPGLGTIAAPSGAVHALEPDRNPERLDDADHDRPVPGVLGQLLAPGLALLGQARQVRDDHLEQLEDDRRVDVGHDPERENRQPPQRAAREHVEEAEQRPLRGLEEGVESREVDARRRDVRPDAIDHEQAEREQDPLAQLRYRKDASDDLDHRFPGSPPATR